MGDLLFKNKKSIWRFVPMILIMIGIFLFSMMPGDESSKTSGAFLTALVKVVEGISHKDLSGDTLASLHHVIRKIAHFTEYGFLGASIMFAIWDKWKGHKIPFLLPELIAMLYACTDEIHQYYVPGRYGTWTDVLIDSCGAITGILIFWKIYRKIHKKQ